MARVLHDEPRSPRCSSLPSAAHRPLRSGSCGPDLQLEREASGRLLPCCRTSPRTAGRNRRRLRKSGTSRADGRHQRARINHFMNKSGSSASSSTTTAPPHRPSRPPAASSCTTRQFYFAVSATSLATTMKRLVRADRSRTESSDERQVWPAGRLDHQHVGRRYDRQRLHHVIEVSLSVSGNDVASRMSFSGRKNVSRWPASTTLLRHRAMQFAPGGRRRAAESARLSLPTTTDSAAVRCEFRRSTFPPPAEAARGHGSAAAQRDDCGCCATDCDRGQSASTHASDTSSAPVTTCRRVSSATAPITSSTARRVVRRAMDAAHRVGLAAER